MREYDTQLLCTFATYQTYLQEVRALVQYYDIPENAVYVLQSTLDFNDIFLTFNAKRGKIEFYPRTMAVHRKKEYNVIYSINALNELIRSETGGMSGREYQVDWEQYRNSFISTSGGKFRVIPTKLLTISRL